MGVLIDDDGAGRPPTGSTVHGREHLPVQVSYTEAGKDEEFTAFMVSATPALSRTAWLLCGDTHRAEELVQHALMKTYMNWSRARHGDPLAYTRRTLANARIDSWRKHRREHLSAPEDLPDLARASGEDAHADRDQLVRALAHLSARQRRVVVLRHLVGLSEKEVAQDLGISVGTVKTTASRGLHRLRTLLTQGTDEAGTSGAIAGGTRR